MCNIALGGNQPPSLVELLKTKGREEVKRIKQQQGLATKQTVHKRNEQKIEQFKLLMSQNMMLKDIAATLQVTTATLRKWSKKYDIPINYIGKEQKIKTHLNSLRDVIRNAVPKTAKTYTIKTPQGNVLTTQKLVLFCKEHNLDYANLRRTYKGNAHHHKGYTIIDQQEPNL